MLISIILIITLTVINGIFSAVEVALISVNDASVENEASKGSRKARRVLKFIKSQTTYLSAIQIGITIIGLLSGALLSDSITNSIIVLFNNFDPNTVRVISIIVLTLILSYFQIVFGELVPKKLGMKYARGVAYNLVFIIEIITIIARPFVFLLTTTSNGIGRLLGIKNDSGEKKVSEEEIRMLVNTSSEKGMIDTTESTMINNVFEFNDTVVSEIMTHRTSISAINIKDDKETILQFITSEKFTRYPVYQDSLDHIIGIINVKDLFFLLNHNNSDFDIKKYMRAPHYVPETKNIKELFYEMQKTKNHIAIIVDEYSGVSGLITIEDLIEEVVGNIFDEYDEIEDEVVKSSENTYIVDGLANISDIEDEIHVGLPVDDYDTVSGFILGTIGHIPASDEEIVFTYNDYQFKVVLLDGNVIEKVEIRKL